MKQILGILGLVVFVCLFNWAFAGIRPDGSSSFLNGGNLGNVLNRTGMLGVIGIGAAFVIMGRGIDLSIGSVICLVGMLTPWLLVEKGWSPWIAPIFLLLMACSLGLVHGLLVTRLNLQPFVVTLCGLLVYRGVARGITHDQTQGFRGGFDELQPLVARIPVTEHFSIPVTCLILAVIAVAAAFVLRRTVFGRYLLAIGRSEPAARYSGIDTRRVITTSYVISAGLAGLGGLLYVLDTGSAQPADFGNFYELYAITAAVLGGCSLLGGEGSIVGVIVGAAAMVLLQNTVRLVDWIPETIEYAVLGVVLLAGVVTDQLVKRAVAQRRQRTSATRRTEGNTP